MRARSITIYAENEEDYYNKYDEEITVKESYPRSRLSQKAFDSLQDYDDYGNLGPTNFSESTYCCSDEEKFIDNISNYDKNKSPSSLTEEDTDLLCNYLKSTISSSFNKKTEMLFFNKGNKLRSTLSGNAICEFKLTNIIDSLISPIRANDYDIKDGDSSSDDDSNDMNTSDLMIEIIETENNENVDVNDQSISFDHIKLMTITNNPSVKRKLLEQFIEGNYSYVESPFEIRKRDIKIYKEATTLQIFDTEALFHTQSLSNVYYNICNGFIFLIDASEENSIGFIEEMIQRINGYSQNKTITIIAFHAKEHNDNHEEKLKRYAENKGILFLPLKCNQFNIENRTIQNLLCLIKIKKCGIKCYPSAKRRNEESIDSRNRFKRRKPSNLNLYSYNYKNIEDNTNSMGYTNNYRLKNYTALDIKDDDNDNNNNNVGRKKTVRRKMSVH